MNRKDLVDTLNLVKPALAENNMVPVFQCFMFDTGTVTATNDQIAITAPAKGMPVFATNGNTLLGLLNASKAEEANFTLNGQDAHVKCGRSTFKLPFIPKEGFLAKLPSTADFKESFDFTPLFLEGLQSCLLTSSRDNTQPALMGVNLKMAQSLLYSCDGDAVTRYDYNPTKKGSNKPDKAHMLPNGFCEALLSICKANDIGKGSLYINDDWVIAGFGGGDYIVYGRIIKIDKPIDYEDLIKKTMKGVKPQWVEVPRHLDGALSRARVVADPESAKTVLTVGDGRFKLHTETHMGVVRDNLAWADGEQTTGNVSAALVQRAIGLCDQMAVLPNCTCYRRDQHIFQLLSNMG